MEILTDFAMLATNACRSRAYLDLMYKKKLIPSFVLVLEIDSVVKKSEELSETDLFCNIIPLEDMLIQYEINYKVLRISNINDSMVFDAIAKLNQLYFIFSIPGYILGAGYFQLGKKYIHIHPGNLPDYRGSTPMYYSILKEKKMAATAIFMEEKIDTGPVLKSIEFNLPDNFVSIDTIYDPWMRAVVLTCLLEDYCREGKFELQWQDKNQGEMYYIIHPVLKCLSIESLANSLKNYDN